LLKRHLGDLMPKNRQIPARFSEHRIQQSGGRFMTATTKKTLIISGMFLLVALIAIGGLIYFLSMGPSEDYVEKMNEGRAFGRSTDQNGCMKEGLSRAKKILVLDTDNSILNDKFVVGCLDTSRASPGFCDNVPGLVLSTFENWERKQCKKSGMDPVDTDCKSVFSHQVSFCEWGPTK
jgi:hypothetical protein